MILQLLAPTMAIFRSSQSSTHLHTLLQTWMRRVKECHKSCREWEPDSEE